MGQYYQASETTSARTGRRTVSGMRGHDLAQLNIGRLVAPRGHRPTAAEAIERLRHLREHGPTPTAFTFRQRFDADAAETAADARDGCPA